MRNTCDSHRLSEKLLKLFGDIFDFGEKRLQRQQNEAIPPFVSLAKLYLERKLRLEIDVILKPGNAGDSVNFRVVLQAKTRSRRLNVHPSLVSSRDPMEWHRLNRCAGNKRANWYEKPVFVSDVELVECPEYYVPSFVGFQFAQNEVSDCSGIGNRSRYTAQKAVLEFGRRFSKRKRDGLGLLGSERRFPNVHNKRVNHDVQTGPKIVNRIARDRAPSERKSVVNFQTKDMISGPWVMVAAHEVWTALSESLGVGIEIGDVSLCISNLFPEPFKVTSHV